MEYRGKEVGRDADNWPILRVGHIPSSVSIEPETTRQHQECCDLDQGSATITATITYNQFGRIHTFEPCLLRNDDNAYKGRVAINLQVLFVVVVLHVSTGFDHFIHA